MKIEIDKKFLSWASGVGASLIAIIIGLYFVCDRINADANSSFNLKFDKRYPVVHAPCEERGMKLEKRVDNIDANQRNQALALKILVKAQNMRMTYEQKQSIVDDLVKNDSISYDSAYSLLDQPLPRRIRNDH